MAVVTPEPVRLATTRARSASKPLARYRVSEKTIPAGVPGAWLADRARSVRPLGPFPQTPELLFSVTPEPASVAAKSVPAPPNAGAEGPMSCVVLR